MRTLVLTGAMCLAVLGTVEISKIDVIPPAHAQAVPKSLEQGGTESSIKDRKNAKVVGVAGGLLSGTNMFFADELAQVLDDAHNLRVLLLVTYGGGSNLD